MCGILGVSGDFEPDAIARANRRQCHRGPDDRGEFIDTESRIAFGHSRLSIIDLSPLGHQPMSFDDGRIVIVLNGEIYNYRELRAELVAKGHQFLGHSDTEVLLHLYRDSGTDMLERLNGMFAFAIWDARDRSLFVARDAFGVKPLYCAETPRSFAFASEIKALLELIPLDRELDHASLHRYLTFLWSPGAGTPLKSVRKLGPGEALIVRDGRILRQWKWYQFPAFRGVQADLDERTSVAQVTRDLRQAVHRQLVADVPVGAFLSGGLDSSAVVAFAREATPDIRCFTIESTDSSGDGATDDLPYARRVAAHLGVSLDVVHVDAERMANDVATMIAQLDEPLGDPAALNVLYISRLAREHNIKVLLSGAGGDDLFTGYRRHAAMNAERYWGWLPVGARSWLRNATARLDQRTPFFRRAAKAFDGAQLDPDARLINYFRWVNEADLSALYSPDFLDRATLADSAKPMTDYLAELPSSSPRLDRMLALDQRFFLIDHNFAYTDKMSMAASVEVRVPFLDPDLVETAARVPLSFKQRGRTGKWVLKRAMEPYLPSDVIHRPKTGFGAPLRRWLRGELRPLLNDVLSADALERRGLFQPTAVQRLIDRNQRGEVDSAYTLLALMGVEIWCRTYIDGTCAA
jgi:asparagine synthase (glutamine-hydrolysing)